MGFAQGTLLKDILPNYMADTWSYLENQIDQVIPWFPTWLQQWIADFGLDIALDMTYYLTVEYTPDHFYEEIRGICDASGGDYNTVVRVHMIAGLTQGACSMFGAWGKAVDPSINLLQLRALDWNMDGPFRQFSQVTVYHPLEGNAFANIAMPGFIGGLTGVSSSMVGISEIGVGYPDSTFGSESRIGYPFIFLLRDILQFDTNLDAAITRMSNAKRTCAIWLGCGDGKRDFNRMNIFEYSASDLVVIDADTVIPYPSNSSKYTHPLIKDVVYWGINQQCLSALLQQQRGRITPQDTIKNIIPLSKTGDLHAAIYDLTGMMMWVANARADGESGPLNAYDRPFVQFNMTALFNDEKRPTL